MRQSAIGFTAAFLTAFTMSVEAVERGVVFTGQVIRVADGDTLTVLRGGKENIRVRLSEIDAPESGQGFGRASKTALSGMCMGREARVVSLGRDRKYKDRIIGRVFCNGVDVSAEQVSQGMAWVYDSYVQDRNFYQLQERARSAGLGLWSQPNPVQPWVWRRGEQARKASVATGKGEVKGNRVSSIYHLPSCPSYESMNPRNAVYFTSEADAAAAGFRKAGNCPN